MLRAGDLRHVVEIQGYTLTADEVKQFAGGSDAFAVVRASIRQLRGGELFAAQQEFATASVEIGIRYLEGVNAGMRVKHEDVRSGLITYYNILNVNDVDRRGFDMLLTCETGISETK